MSNTKQITNPPEVLVKVEGLSKKFCKNLKTSLWYGVKDLLSGVSGASEERVLRPKEFWAVKDINFELRRGECLGLIGHNGAGKSTLLKILNGLINPDAGKVTIKGRIGALIELGAGFNPILSGRENIYNNGAILGFSRKEIDSKLEAIIAFAELEEFIDMPVQHYSSGMKVRLGFAVAAEMEPDVLIIDEVLAVGDINFKTKCLNRIGELLPTCVTIFVSHAMPQIARTSSRVLLMSKGKCLIDTTDISLGIQSFYKEMISSNNKGVSFSNGKTELLSFSINGTEIVSDNVINIEFNKELKFSAILQLEDTDSGYHVSYAFIDVDTKIVANVYSKVAKTLFHLKGKVLNETIISNLCLGAGVYNVSISVYEVLPSGSRGEIYLYNTSIGSIQIINVATSVAPVQFLGKWKEIKQNEVN
ncbi:ABC transporter ATP-binding protein [Lacinutrix sp. C3R15]|uniref:ABC transporter ATP-binding protein n=1 Tax=Flavobacteriaceae TaxID=49546 RepID=UPI001C09A00E|nr:MULTISPECIES: ABC transporter ATP-binding protein [Flavobacteriaceae]MBU2939558.1 ABC transporter ATP-binding protein [Lacinutrix sp. C3R15]MDO6622872.1 ABC transporter ATP-binding protein [Oceanihabitans sp. 1_MG-2023]